MSGLFAFFPVKPVKKYNHVLVPNSTLLPRSALVPVDPVTRKPKCSNDRKPVHGPVSAYAMSSDPGGISIGAVGGYGNSNYGSLAYGESISLKSKKEKAIFEEFRFFPVKPVKKYNHVLVPNSTLLPHSALVPVNPVTRKPKCSTDKKPLYGPVSAYSMSSDPGGISIGAVGSYGNSNYGSLAYGESTSRTFSKSKREKAIFEELEKRMPNFLYG